MMVPVGLGENYTTITSSTSALYQIGIIFRAS
jgi:hypothetical protein